jgi:hypothetical protein
MGRSMEIRKLIQGGAVEQKKGRDIPGGPKDGYRRTTARQRKDEYLCLIDTMGNKK